MHPCTWGRHSRRGLVIDAYFCFVSARSLQSNIYVHALLLLPVSVSPQGGMVLVSHDFRLIDQVANEIWVCEKQVGLKLRVLCRTVQSKRENSARQHRHA